MKAQLNGRLCWRCSCLPSWLRLSPSGHSLRATSARLAGSGLCYSPYLRLLTAISSSSSRIERCRRASNREARAGACGYVLPKELAVGHELPKNIDFGPSADNNGLNLHRSRIGLELPITSGQELGK